VLRKNETPAIDVYIVNSAGPPGGMGEAGTAAIAPALTNAIYAATGTRVRRLPVANQAGGLIYRVDGCRHGFVEEQLMKPNLPRVAAIATGLRGMALFFFFLLGCKAAVAQDATQTAEQEYPKYGLLRERDLTPFGFLRLDMRPAHAFWAPPGSWGVEVLLDYQNTWAMSPNVQQYLESLPGRGRLGPADVAAIRALPGEA
jgi:hypothetical protein